MGVWIPSFLLWNPTEALDFYFSWVQIWLNYSHCIFLLNIVFIMMMKKKFLYLKEWIEHDKIFKSLKSQLGQCLNPGKNFAPMNSYSTWLERESTKRPFSLSTIQKRTFQNGEKKSSKWILNQGHAFTSGFEMNSISQVVIIIMITNFSPLKVFHEFSMVFFW